MSGMKDHPIPKDTPGGDPQGVEIPNSPVEVVRPEMPNRPGDPGWEILGPTQFPAEPGTGEPEEGNR